VKPLLALFDVDGTLFLTDDTIAGEAFTEALRDVYGVDPPADAVARTDHPGQTSMRIARLVLRSSGLDDDRIAAALPEWCARFAARYAVLLEGVNTTEWQVAPGAVDALARLTEAEIHLGLLTGNPEPMARARMTRLGLERFFPEGQGAFGCDAEERSELIRIARERAGRWPLDRMVAVGDTPRDLSGAHAAGIRAISVKPGDDLNEVADVLIALNRQP
jgi:phosphoglycolate phosphatase